MRGATVNASVCAVISSFLVASKQRSASRGRELIRRSPSLTMSRFSPVSGTLSATVETAARSSSGYAFSPKSAQATLKATPRAAEVVVRVVVVKFRVDDDAVGQHGGKLVVVGDDDAHARAI